MLINTPISLGELVDKISILRIKKKNIDNKNKLTFIIEELSLLELTLLKFVDNKKVHDYLEKLVKINSK